MASLKKPWLCICSLHQLIVHEPPTHSICGCQKKCMMFWMLLLILFQMIMKWNMSLLSCLGWHTQVVYFTCEKSNLQSYANALIIFCHVEIWPCWNHLMACVWGMHFWKVNSLLWMKKYLLVNLVHLWVKAWNKESQSVWIVFKFCFSKFWKITVGTLYIKKFI